MRPASRSSRARRVRQDLGIRVGTTATGPDSVNSTVTPTTGTPRSYGPFTKVEDLVNAIKADPDVNAEVRGGVLPTPLAATSLGRRVTLEVVAEGRDTSTYPNLANLAAIAAISDPVVAFRVVERRDAATRRRMMASASRRDATKGRRWSWAET